MEPNNNQPKPELTPEQKAYLMMLQAQRGAFGCVGCGDPGVPDDDILPPWNN